MIGLLTGQYLLAQEMQTDSIPSWTQKKKLGVMMNQSSFDNWLAGGVNSFSGTLNFDYDLAYQSEKWEWTTTLDAALGYAKISDSEYFNKTEDQLEITTRLERKGKKGVQFSSSFNLKTQHAPGYVLIENNEVLEKTKTSAFFSPAYMRLGAGFAFKKGAAIAWQLNPLNVRLIVVDKLFTASLSEGETFFGVSAGKTARWEMGPSFSLQSKVQLLKNVELLNTVNVVTNYLTEFKNLDLDYTSTLNMKINDYLSTVLEVQLVYDDNALAALQFRQVFGLAVSWPF